MALRKRGRWRYGDGPADTRAEIVRYSREVGHVAEQFADAVCACGGRVFGLWVDNEAGVASRVCVACVAEAHPIGDSADYLDDANEEECACPCGGEALEVTVGVALYADSDDVRWLYVGGRCPACGLTAVYGDWKNEFDDFRQLLARA